MFDWVRRSVRRTTTVTVGIGLVVAACGDDGRSRTDVLSEYATDVAAPRYELFASTAGKMATAVQEACSAPSQETITRALVTVEHLRGGWLSILAMSTGPAMERRSAAVIDWPVRAADVERFVTGAEPGDITADVIANNVGADTRGLSAIHWVLSTDDVGDRLADQRWCDYVSSTAAVVANESHLLVDDWTVSFAGGDSETAGVRVPGAAGLTPPEPPADPAVLTGFGGAAGAPQATASRAPAPASTPPSSSIARPRA